MQINTQQYMVSYLSQGIVINVSQTGMMNTLCPIVTLVISSSLKKIHGKA